MSQTFSLSVNGTSHTVEADPDTPLLYVLRDDLGLNNPHFGCGLAQCGACTVHLDGQATRSCVTPISVVGDCKIVTLGLGDAGQAAPAANGLYRRAGPAMRLLHQWLDHDRGCVPARQEEADRRGDQGCAVRTEMPLRHSRRYSPRGQTRRGNDGLRRAP